MQYDKDNNFAYHSVDKTGQQKLASVRIACKNAITALESLVPDGREIAIVRTKLEEAMFWANAGIARGYDRQVKVE